MAKKSSKKPAKKPAPKAKPAAKKPAPKAKAKSAARPKPASMLEPRPVSTGRGATAAQIGADLVALFNVGRGDEVQDKWWSPEVTSVEGHGVALAWVGKRSAEAKNADWMKQHTILGASAEGPYLGASGFAVKYQMHVRENASGRELRMDEVGVYTVAEGKIIREEFMYAAE